jgi:hypothetical protein
VRRGQQLPAVTTAAIKPTSPCESPSFENRGQVQLDAKNLRVSMVQFHIVMNAHNATIDLRGGPNQLFMMRSCFRSSSQT